jgi:hypothetical protein
VDQGCRPTQKLGSTALAFLARLAKPVSCLDPWGMVLWSGMRWKRSDSEEIFDTLARRSCYPLVSSHLHSALRLVELEDSSARPAGKRAASG